jgi:SAM-dependent methyltransferase
MRGPSDYDADAFFAEFYDYLPAVAGRQDRDFYLELARSTGDPILELGCGTGRILLPLAEAGHRVVGLDLSERMLARCRTKLEAAPPEVRQRVRLVRGDMTRFDLGETFRVVAIPFRPFQHLLRIEEQLACLRSVHRHLAAGGKFVVDFFQTDPRRMHDPIFLQPSEPLPEVKLPDGRRVVMRDRTAAFHRAEQQNDVEFLFDVTYPDGRVERLTHAFAIRYFFRFEVEHLLARSGFRVVELFGDFNRSPLRDDSLEMIFVAKKS